MIPKEIYRYTFSKKGIIITNILMCSWIIIESYLLFNVNWSNVNNDTNAVLAILLGLIAVIILIPIWCWFTFDAEIRSWPQQIKLIKQKYWSYRESKENVKYIVKFEYFIYKRQFFNIKLKNVIWEREYNDDIDMNFLNYDTAMQEIMKWLENKKAESKEQPDDEVMAILNIEDELKKIIL